MEKNILFALLKPICLAEPKKRIPHFVFIHGVGEGVLKQELHTILGRYDFLVFEDAPYYKYGLGATLVSYKL